MCMFVYIYIYIYTYTHVCFVDSLQTGLDFDYAVVLDREKQPSAMCHYHMSYVIIHYITLPYTIL